jgi:hypothetical protein
MRTFSARPIVGLALFVAAVAVTACTAAPTGPSAARLLPGTAPARDLIPCDSTIITDGTCKGGFIIPH